MNRYPKLTAKDAAALQEFLRGSGLAHHAISKGSRNRRDSTVKPELQKLARHRLSRAKHVFNDGEHLFSMGSLAGAVNRFYYAAFYPARALLATANWTLAAIAE